VSVVTSSRITPWLLGPLYEESTPSYSDETQHVDWSVTSPLTTRFPACMAAAFDSCGRMTELALISVTGAGVRGWPLFPNTIFTATQLHAVYVHHRMHVCIQLFQVLYALFPWRTLRWLRSLAQMGLPDDQTMRASCTCTRALTRLCADSVCLHPLILESDYSTLHQSALCTPWLGDIVRDLAHAHTYTEFHDLTPWGTCFSQKHTHGHSAFHRGAAVQELTLCVLRAHTYTHEEGRPNVYTDVIKDFPHSVEFVDSTEQNAQDTDSDCETRGKRAVTFSSNETEKQLDTERGRSSSSAPAFSPSPPKEFVTGTRASDGLHLHRSKDVSCELERCVETLRAHLAIEQARNAQLNDRLRELQVRLDMRVLDRLKSC
jgi:hypothetical protein